MLAALKAEVRKLLTVRSTYVIAGISFVLVCIFAFYANGIKASPGAVHDAHHLASQVTGAVQAISLLGALVGVLLMTHEYRYNTIMYTLTASNSRSKTLLAKVLVASGFAVLFTLLFAALSPLMTLLGLHLKGLVLVPQEFAWHSLLWRAVFFGWGFSMVGLLLAVLIRSQVGTIVTLFLAPGTVESLVGLLLRDHRVYLPFTVLQQVLEHQYIPTQLAKGQVPHIALSFGRSALLFLLYLVVSWTIGWMLFLRRDAN